MRQSRLSKALHPRHAPDLIRFPPMTAQEVERDYIRALDDYNDYMERNKEVKMLYEDEFKRSAAMDPYERKKFLEDLIQTDYNRERQFGGRLTPEARHFREASKRLQALWFWSEKAAQYKVGQDIVSGIDPGGVGNWLQTLLGSEHHLHPEYEPVKGKVFLPNHLQRP